MLLDGYWKRDLIKFMRQLIFWSRRGGSIMQEYAEHRVNRILLFSAAIIRKIVEDETDAKAIIKKEGLPMAPFNVLNYTVPMQVFKHIDKEKFFVNSRLILSDYDTEHEEQIEMCLSHVCNQLIHSYVWGIVHTENGNKIYGVLTASDRFKETEVYLLQISDWINTLDFVAKNCHINSKESLL